jgi:hypothetical protein
MVGSNWDNEFSGCKNDLTDSTKWVFLANDPPTFFVFDMTTEVIDAVFYMTGGSGVETWTIEQHMTYYDNGVLYFIA